jgi:hypothetical protein
MRNKVPVSREDRPPLPDFAPVPLRYRHDGWTPERQRGFIEALAATRCHCLTPTRSAAAAWPPHPNRMRTKNCRASLQKRGSGNV